MAGSIKWFVYTTDEGDDFALKADESNTERLNGGTQDFPDGAPPTLYALPRNVQPRHVVYTSADGTVSRKIYALTPTIFNGADGALGSFNDTLSGQTLILKRKIGEVISYPFGPDTSQTDGDAT